jgi:hypothetical protein
MTRSGTGRSRNRSRGSRELTIREIKTAICAHDKIQPQGQPELAASGAVWRTKMSCPTCGAWYIHETASARLVPQPEGDPHPAVIVA